MKTVVQATITSVVGAALFGLLVFLPAGTVAYWRGWAFIAVFAAATLIPSAYLAVKNPDALRRRMQAQCLRGPEQERHVCYWRNQGGEPASLKAPVP